MKMKLQPTAVWEPIRAPTASRLETIVARAATLSLPRRRMLGLFLDASLPLPDRNCRPLHAIWVNEARARIDAQSKLLSTLDCAFRRLQPSIPIETSQ